VPGTHKYVMDVETNMQICRSKQASSTDTIDLHGLTISEAKVVVLETLENRDHTRLPLTVITGMGKHSRNQVGVLAPALLNMLREEGWRANTFEAGLIVRDRT